MGRGGDFQGLANDDDGDVGREDFLERGEEESGVVRGQDESAMVAPGDAFEQGGLAGDVGFRSGGVPIEVGVVERSFGGGAGVGEVPKEGVRSAGDESDGGRAGLPGIPQAKRSPGGRGEEAEQQGQHSEFGVFRAHGKRGETRVRPTGTLSRYIRVAYSSGGLKAGEEGATSTNELLGGGRGEVLFTKRQFDRIQHNPQFPDS